MIETRKDIRQRRRAAEISQRELALAAGVHPVTLSRFETGVPVKPAVLAAILEALDKLERGRLAS